MLCQGKRPQVTAWSDAFACQWRVSPSWAESEGVGGGLVALVVEFFCTNFGLSSASKCLFHIRARDATCVGCCASERLAFFLSIFRSLFFTRPRLPLIRPTLEISTAIIAHLHLRFPSRSSAPNPRLCVRPCASAFGLYGELVGLFFFFFLSPTPPAPPHAGCPLLI